MNLVLISRRAVMFALGERGGLRSLRRLRDLLAWYVHLRFSHRGSEVGGINVRAKSAKARVRTKTISERQTANVLLVDIDAQAMFISIHNGREMGWMGRHQCRVNELMTYAAPAAVFL